MGGREVTVQKKSATALVQAGDDPGSFEILLSTSARDRENEIVSAKDWEQPLPASIPLNSDHNPSVHAVVGSGQPFLDGDSNLRVVGKFASTPEGQHLRTLVNEGHVQSVSVEFIRNAAKGVNTLVGGAFVTVPANPEARVLSAKAFSDELDRVIKAAGGGDAAMVQAIHDAAGHLGAACIAVEVPVEDTDEDPTGAQEGANKAAALALRLKALGRG
jgi:hypothetical protein